MIKKRNYYQLMMGLIAIFFVLGMVACAPSTPVIETPAADPEIEMVVPAATEPQITPPTPEPQPTVLLALGSDVDPFSRSQTQRLLESLTADSALDLVVQDTLAPEMITPEVELVIGMGGDLDLNSLASGAPSVFFVAIGDPGAIVADNLSVIGDPILEMRQKAFLAGYLSAVISRDNKIVAFINSISDASDLMVESYVAGARFYCGICQPVYPPYNPFPQWEILTPDAASDGFRPIVNNFFNIDVEVVYVQGELASPALLDYLEELGMNVVGDRAPDQQRSNWVGTIIMDPGPALESLWPDLLSGAPGVQVPSAIVLTDTESGLISTGRYRLIENMVANLQAGLVSVESTPQ